MAYNAYCDTAAATKWWFIGTGSTANTLSVVMSDNPSGVEEYDNLGNYQPWSTFLTEIIANGLYQQHLKVEVGDGSTPTTLLLAKEVLVIDASVITADFVRAIDVKSNATFTGGVVENATKRATYGGATIAIGPGLSHYAYILLSSGGSIYLYSTTLQSVEEYPARLSHSANSATHRIWNCSFNGVELVNPGSNLDCYNLTLSSNPANGTPQGIQRALGTYNYIFLAYVSSYPIYADNSSNDYTFRNAIVLDTGGYSFYLSSAGCNVYAIDCDLGSWGGRIVSGATGKVYRQYSVNIHVVDKDGNNMAGVSVACVDKNSNAAFTTQTTASDGTITEQIATYADYTYSGTPTSPTETIYSPHVFTFSKDGYRTLTMPAVTISNPIDWEIKMLPRVEYDLKSKRYEALSDQRIRAVR